MEVLALTKEFITFNTVSAESNAPFARRLITLLEGLGFTVEQQLMPQTEGRLKLNLIARRADQHGNVAGGLLLAGHMDTVPFQPEQKATLAPVQEGSRLYGRGACDMKGGISAALEAAARFQGQALKAPLTLAFTCDEEVGCKGAKALLGTGLLQSRYAIIGEPTSLAPKRMHKGYYGAEITLKGKACHSSDPKKGVSAIKAAVRALMGIEALEAVLQTLPTTAEKGSFTPDYATLNVGVIQGGVARNVVAEKATFSLEVRPLPGQDMVRFFKQVETVIQKTASSIGARASLKLLTGDAPMVTQKDSEVVKFLEAWSGKSAGSISFSTEGKEFNQMGMESVIFGPGSIDKAHQEDEYVPIEELGRCVEAYSAAIRNFCQ